MGFQSYGWASEPFSFALIGDMPYHSKPGENNRDFQATVDAINADNSIRWTIHVGDIKSGGTACSDNILLDRKRRFNQFEQPFILTPGDNEWTDCHRLLAGAYDPLERLAFLRKTFYPAPGLSLGQKAMELVSQSALKKKHAEFVENRLWAHNQITFATIHLTGSKNGQAPFDKLGGVRKLQKHRNEVVRRNRAANKWLKQVFDYAEERGSKAIFIAIHANPGLEKKALSRHKKPFQKFLVNLENRIKAFKLPVVLAHGDSHYFRIDRPILMREKRLTNFTRIETFGDSNSDWIKVDVNPDNNNVFTATAKNSD